MLFSVRQLLVFGTLCASFVHVTIAVLCYSENGRNQQQCNNRTNVENICVMLVKFPEEYRHKKSPPEPNRVQVILDGCFISNSRERGTPHRGWIEGNLGGKSCYPYWNNERSIGAVCLCGGDRCNTDERAKEMAMDHWEEYSKDWEQSTSTASTSTTTTASTTTSTTASTSTSTTPSTTTTTMRPTSTTSKTPLLGISTGLLIAFGLLLLLLLLCVITIAVFVVRDKKKNENGNAKERVVYQKGVQTAKLQRPESEVERVVRIDQEEIKEGERKRQSVPEAVEPPDHIHAKVATV